jgi:hypothetical protein
MKLAEIDSSLDIEKISSLCKRRGFVYQSSEIYGGLASTWDYGPLGVELKRNVKKIYDVINLKKYKFLKRAKENNELFGSIKPKELSKTINEINNIEIKPSQIDLGKEIYKIGEYEAKVNLHAEIQAKIHIQVVKIEEDN